MRFAPDECPAGYFTSKGSCAVLVTPPAVPDTVIVYCPAGVPAGALEEFPPLHAARANIRHTAKPNEAASGRRRTVNAARAIIIAANTASHARRVCCRMRKGSILIPELGGTAARSAVLTVSVAACEGVVLGTTADGATTQEMVAGATQLNVTACEKLPVEVTLIA
jgi:hypothetical protein